MYSRPISAAYGSGRVYQRFETAKQSLIKQGKEALQQVEILDESREKLSTKQVGALFAEIVRDEFSQIIDKFDLPVALSPQNSFVIGSSSEYDLLVVSKNAQAFEGKFFHPKDVVSLVECKASGVFDAGASTSSISRAANFATSMNPLIRFGYICAWENRSKRKGSIDHRKRTEDGLETEIKPDGCVKTLFLATSTSGKIVELATDKEIEDFFIFLAGGSKQINMHQC